MTTTTTTSKRTTRRKREKTLYVITNDATGYALTQSDQYNETLALQWAARELANLKKTTPKLNHATLWQYNNNGGVYKIQGYYRRG